jgi:transporter family-2 protein
MGVTFISTASRGVPRLGVLVFGLVSIAGQLTAGLALDIFLPVSGTSISANLIVGVIMTFVAVAVGSFQRRTP